GSCKDRCPVDRAVSPILPWDRRRTCRGARRTSLRTCCSGACHVVRSSWSPSASCEPEDSRLRALGQVLFTADAHRDNGKRFIVSVDEKLTAFLELVRVHAHELFRFL